MRRQVLTGTLALLVGACGSPDTVHTAVSDSSGARSINPGTPAGAALLELWQLRPGVSFEDWRNAHPDESFSDADTSVMARALGDWCAAAQRRVTLGTRVIARTAFFYPPDPGTLELPDSQAARVRRCELGLVWVSVPEEDSALAARLTDSVRSQLAEAFGRLTEGRVSFHGSAWWSNVSRFRRDEVTAVAALRNPSPAADSAAALPRAVIAFAYQRNAGIGTGSDSPVSTEPWRPADSLPLDSAVRLAGLPPALFAPLATVLSTAASGRHAGIFTPEQTDSLARPLRRWLTASEGLPAPRRAAALYVADVILDKALCSFVRCDAREFATLEPLRALGAQFSWEPIDASWIYQRNWLSQARALDRDSPLGQRILLAQMTAAFDFSGRCAGGAEGFRRVIDNGERYLARVPDAPIAAEVHYLLGDAWRDVVALAHGAAGIYADSSRYSAEAGTAAAKAMAHYREAMKAGPEAEVARQAWRQAWRLGAGLHLRETRFYCVYD